MKFLALLISTVVFAISGALLEGYELIQEPAWWALYGGIYGAFLGTILNK